MPNDEYYYLGLLLCCVCFFVCLCLVRCGAVRALLGNDFFLWFCGRAECGAPAADKNA